MERRAVAGVGLDEIDVAVLSALDSRALELPVICAFPKRRMKRTDVFGQRAIQKRARDRRKLLESPDALPFLWVRSAATCRTKRRTASRIPFQVRVSLRTFLLFVRSIAMLYCTLRQRASRPFSLFAPSRPLSAFELRRL